MYGLGHSSRALVQELYSCALCEVLVPLCGLLYLDKTEGRVEYFLRCGLGTVASS